MFMAFTVFAPILLVTTGKGDKRGQAKNSNPTGDYRTTPRRDSRREEPRSFRGRSDPRDLGYVLNPNSEGDFTEANEANEGARMDFSQRELFLPTPLPKRIAFFLRFLRCLLLTHF